MRKFTRLDFEGIGRKNGVSPKVAEEIYKSAFAFIFNKISRYDVESGDPPPIFSLCKKFWFIANTHELKMERLKREYCKKHNIDLKDYGKFRKEHKKERRKEMEDKHKGRRAAVLGGAPDNDEGEG